VPVSDSSAPASASSGARPLRDGSLRELAAFFLRLGITAFGGPAAHIAIMEDELVRRRGWLSREKFLDLLGASNLIPGPSSSELAIHIGYQRAGFAGLLVQAPASSSPRSRWSPRSHGPMCILAISR